MSNSNVVRMDGNTLDIQAKHIRSLMENLSTNTIELGLALIVARDVFPTTTSGKRPGWHQWLKTMNLSLNTTTNLIRVGERFGGENAGRGRSLAPTMTRQILIELSRHNVPEAAHQEVLTRLERGEKLSTPATRKIVKSHRPKPADANKQAEETGRAVLASDGNYYMGASKESVQNATQRRSVVFGVRRAVETLAVINLTPDQFLKFALPHQLWNEEEGQQIAKAAKFLSVLAKAWAQR